MAVLIPIDHEIALTFISSAISSLLFSEIFFESFRLDIECFLPNITAAAKTGPAMGPLPASSTPASINLITLKPQQTPYLPPQPLAFL